jgi:hypothetical protein
MQPRGGFGRKGGGAARSRVGLNLRLSGPIHAMESPMRPPLFLVAALAVFLAGCESAPKATAEKPPPPWALPEVLAAVVEPAEDPGELVPADARFFVRIDDLAGWQRSGDADPLAGHAAILIRAFRPPNVWKAAAKKLGLDDPAMSAAFFGKTAAVVDQRVDNHDGVVVMTLLDPALIPKIPAAMGLAPAKEARQIGPFKVYTVEDSGKRYVVALGARWFFVTKEGAAPQLRRLLSAVAAYRVRGPGEGAADAINNSPLYNGMMAKLPTVRTASLYTRNNEATEHHAVSVARDNGEVAVHYTATIPQLPKLLGDYDQIDAPDFGPLPASTISATTLSILPHAPPGVGALDITLFPHTFIKNIIPRIKPPITAFLARVPGSEVTPDPGMDVPVFGFAIRLKDPAVAADLDRVIKGVHFLLSLGNFELGQSLFGIRAVSEGSMRYHVADFGPVLAQRFKDPQFSRLVNLPSSAGLTRVTFGRVGGYYVVCSQEAYFRQWIAADAGASQTFSQTSAVGSFSLRRRPNLILYGVTLAPQLSAMFDEVAAYWAKVGTPPTAAPTRPATVLDTAQAEAQRLTDPVEKPLVWVSDGIRRQHSFHIQLWREDPTTLRGELRTFTPHDAVSGVAAP